jgi:chromate transporter
LNQLTRKSFSDNSRMLSEAQESRHPQSKTELFMVFTFLALQGFGGVLAVVQRELVERRKWMTKVQFVEEWSVAQVMPGPNVVNLCLMIGGKYFGVAGALAAVGGLICGPLVLVLGLAILFGGVADNAVAQGALKGMGAVAAGLVIATGLKLGTSLPKNPMGLWTAIPFAVMSFACVGIFRWPLPWVLLGLGSLTCLIAYRALKQLPSKLDAKTSPDQEAS